MGASNSQTTQQPSSNNIRPSSSNSSSHTSNLAHSSSTPKINTSNVNFGSPNISTTRRRVLNEKKEILNNPPVNWKIICSEQRWNQWDVWITAQTNCPFHSIPFKLTVQFVDGYPHKPPLFKLEEHSKFFHPNISSKGTICQTTIKSDEPTLTIRQRIDAFIELLATPNPESAYNAQAATLFKNDYRSYYRKAVQKFNGFI